MQSNGLNQEVKGLLINTMYIIYLLLSMDCVHSYMIMEIKLHPKLIDIKVVVTAESTLF